MFIRNDGNDQTGTIVLRSAGNKISSNLVNSNGAKIHMDGEVELGSFNHAAQIFSNSSVSGDMHIRTTHASSGILLDPATKRVTVNGNVALNGGTLLSQEKDLTLFSAGAGKKNIVLDPRTQNDGGDVRVLGNIILEENQLEGISSNLTVNGKNDLVLTSDSGNVFLQLDNCSMKAQKSGTLELQGNSGITATSSADIDLVSSGDTTFAASNNLEGQGQGVTLTSVNISRGAKMVSGGANVSLTQGNAFVGGANVHVQSHNGELKMTGTRAIRVVGNGSEGVWVQATNGNVSLTSTDYTNISTDSMVCDANTDATVLAANVARVAGGVCNLSSTAGDMLVSANSKMQVQSGDHMTLQGSKSIVSTAVGNVTTLASNVHASAGSGASKLDLLHSGSAQLVSQTGTLVKSVSGDVVADATAASVVITAGTDTTMHAANVSRVRSDGLAHIIGAQTHVESTGAVTVSGAQLVLETASGDVQTSSGTGNISSAAKNVDVSAHDSNQQQTVGLTLLTSGDAELVANRNIAFTPVGNLSATCGNVQLTGTDGTLQGSNVAAVRSTTLALVKSAADAKVEAVDVTIEGVDSVVTNVQSGIFSVNSKILQLDAYDGALSVATLELENNGDVNMAGEGDVSITSTASNVVTTASAGSVSVSATEINHQATSKIHLDSTDKVVVTGANLDVTTADINLTTSAGTSVTAHTARLEALAGDMELVGTGGNAILKSSALTTVESDVNVRVNAKAGDTVVSASQDVEITPSQHLVMTASTGNARTTATNVHLNATNGKTASINLLGSTGSANVLTEAGLSLTSQAGDVSAVATVGNVSLTAGTDMTVSSANTSVVRSDNKSVVDSVNGTHVTSAANVDVTASHHVSIVPTGNLSLKSAVGDIMAATGSNVKIRSSVADINGAESATPTMLALSSDGDASLSASRDVTVTAHSGDIVASADVDVTVHSANVSTLSSDDKVAVVATNEASIDSSSVVINAGTFGMSATGGAQLSSNADMQVSSVSTSVSVVGAKDAVVQGGSNVMVDATSVLLATGDSVHIAATTDALTPSDSMGGLTSLELASSGDSTLSAENDLAAIAVNDSTVSAGNVAALRSTTLSVVSGKDCAVSATSNVDVTSSMIRLTPTVDFEAAALGGNATTSAHNVYVNAVHNGASVANIHVQKTGRTTLSASKSVSATAPNVLLTASNIETSATTTKISSADISLESTGTSAITSSAGDVNVSAAGLVSVTAAANVDHTSHGGIHLNALNNKDITLTAYDINLFSANLISFETNGGGIDMGANAAIDSEHLNFYIDHEFVSNTGGDTTFNVGGDLNSTVTGNVVTTTTTGNIFMQSGTTELVLDTTLASLEATNVSMTNTDFTNHSSNACTVRSDGVLSLHSATGSWSDSETITVAAAKDLMLSSTTGDVTHTASAGNAVTEAVSVSMRSSNGSDLELSTDAALTSTGDIDLTSQGTATVSGATHALLTSNGTARVQSTAGTVIASAANVNLTPSGDLVLNPSGNLVATSDSATLTSGSLSVQTTGATNIGSSAFAVQTTGATTVDASSLGVQTTGATTVGASSLVVQTTGPASVDANSFAVQTTGASTVDSSSLDVQTTGPTTMSSSSLGVQTSGNVSMDASNFVVQTSGVGSVVSSDVTLQASSGDASLSTSAASLQMTHGGQMSLQPNGNLLVTVGGNVVQSSQDATVTSSNVAHIQATKKISVQSAGQVQVVANVLDMQSTAATLSATSDVGITAGGSGSFASTGVLVLSGSSANIQSTGGTATVGLLAVGDAVVTSNRHIDLESGGDLLASVGGNTNIQTTTDTMLTAGNAVHITATAGDATVASGRHALVSGQVNATILATSGDVASHSKSGNASTTATNVNLKALVLDTDTGETDPLSAHATLDLFDTGVAQVEAGSDIVLTAGGDFLTEASGNVETTAANTVLTTTDNLKLLNSGATLVTGQTLTLQSVGSTVLTGAGNVDVQSGLANVHMTPAGMFVGRAAKNIDLNSSGDTLVGASNVSVTSVDATISASNVAHLKSDGNTLVHAGVDTLTTATRDIKHTSGRHHVVTATGNTSTTGANTKMSSSTSPTTSIELLGTGNATMSSAKSMTLTALAGDITAGAGNVSSTATHDATVSASNAATLKSDGLVTVTAGGSAQVSAVGVTVSSTSDMLSQATGNMTTSGATVTVNSAATSLVLTGDAKLSAPSGDVELLPAGDVIAHSSGGNVSAEGATVTLKSVAAGGLLSLPSTGGASLTAPTGDITLQPSAGAVRLLAQGVSGDLVATATKDATLGSANVTTVRSDIKIDMTAPTAVLSTANTTVTASNKFVATGTQEAVVESDVQSVLRSSKDTLVSATANVSVTAGAHVAITPTSNFKASSASGRVDLESLSSTARVAGASNVAVLQLEAGGRSALTAGAGGMDLRLPTAGDFATTVSAGNALVQALDTTVHASNACVLKSDALLSLQATGALSATGSTVGITSSGDVSVQPSGDLLMDLTSGGNVVTTTKNVLSLLAKDDGNPDSSLVLNAGGDSVLKGSRNVSILPTGDLSVTTTGNIVSSAHDVTTLASNANILRSDGVCKVQSTGGDTQLVSSADIVATPSNDLLLTPGRHMLVTATGNASTVGVNAKMESSLSPGTQVHLLSTGDAVMNAQKDVGLSAVDNMSCTSNNFNTSATLNSTITSGNASVLRSDGLVSVESSQTQMTSSGTTNVSSTGVMTLKTTGSGDLLAQALGSGDVRAKGTSVVLESTQNTTKFHLLGSGDTVLDASGATSTFDSQVLVMSATGNANTSAANIHMDSANAKLHLLQTGHANLEAQSGVLIKPTTGDIVLNAASGQVDVDCQTLDVQSTTATVSTTNTTLTSTGTAQVQANQLLMSASAANLHSTTSTRVYSDALVDIRADTELTAFAPKANVSAQNDLILSGGNVSASGTTYSTAFTGGHTSTCLDFTQTVSRSANLVSQYKGFSFEALDSNNGYFDVHTAKRINLETEDLNLMATNVNWQVAGFVATHAEGFKIENTHGHMELKSANDVILGPSANLEIQSDNINITSVGAATFRSTQADLSLEADTHINLNPATATRTGMPVEFSSNSNSHHVKATSGPLRLKGGDADSTVRVDGNLEVSGTIDYITTNASTIHIEDKQVVLGMSDNNDDDDADGAGLIVNGTKYETDPSALSLLWNKTDSAQASANDAAPFWKLSGGDLSITRVIPQAAWESPFHDDETAGYQNAEQVVEYRWCITHDEKLQLIKLRGRKELGVNMAASGADKQIIAEFNM